MCGRFLMSKKNDAPTQSTRKVQTINPATEEVLNEYDIISQEQINELVRRARNEFMEWKRDIDKRADHLYSFANELRKNKENLAGLLHRRWENQ